MDIYLLLAYITGGLMVAYSLFLYVFPSRKLSLVLKAIGDLLSVINGVFIYLATDNPLMFAAIATTSIGFIREIIFSLKNEIKIFKSWAWPITFSIVFCLSLIFTYVSPISIIPVVASVISSVALYLTNKKYFNIGIAISCALYITYYALLIPINNNLLTIFALLSTLTGFISAIVGLIIVIKKKSEDSIVNNNEQ